MKNLNRLPRHFFIARFLALSFVSALFFIFQAGCRTLQVESQWRDREITIDGNSDDWLGALYYFEDERISVGFLNDESHIYLCLISENPMIRAQVMGQGLTLWFDPEGGKQKTFGIHYPIGRQGLGNQENLMRMRGEELDREELREAFERSMTELEILGPGESEPKRMPIEEAKGIDIKLKPSSGLLVYEIKVPLLRSEQYPYAVGARAGGSIGIGLEIPKMDLSAMRERMGGRRPQGGGMPPGGGGRGGMGGRGGGRGMPGGRGPQMPKGLKVWVTVQLASSAISSVPE